MGFLSDFFIADTALALALAVDGPVGRDVPTVMAKSVESVKLATLYQLITGEDSTDDVEESVATDLEEGPWLTVIGDQVTVAVAGLPDHRIGDVAAAWAATDEWGADGAARDDILVLLRELRDLARRAAPPAHRMYLWTCL